MKHKWWQVLQYIKYLLTARTKYYIHSPFVYELCEQVIYDRRRYYAFDDIALLRSRLLANTKVIEVTDFGSGSQRMGKLRSIGEIAKYAGAPAKVGHLLFRLIAHLKPKYVLELGTSLGISTLYMATASPRAKIVTLEGCMQIAQVAQENFTRLAATNIEQVNASFEEALPLVLQHLPQVDFVFFDGNHRSEATLHYFKLCLAKAHEESVLIFDDIHWSSDMELAWLQIQQHPSVSVTLDLFRVGLVFFRKEQVKEHFKLYF